MVSFPRLSISRLSGRTGDREEAAGASQPEALPVALGNLALDSSGRQFRPREERGWGELLARPEIRSRRRGGGGLT